MSEKREDLKKQVEILKKSREQAGLNRKEFSEYMGIPDFICGRTSGSGYKYNHSEREQYKKGIGGAITNEATQR